MIIHFMCIGNIYRSRLAQAYLNSKQIANLIAISSGIEAGRNTNTPITWYAQKILEKENLIQFKAPMWQKTTKELLEKGDFTVFMYKDIYDFCTKNLGFISKNFQVWDIKDMFEYGKTDKQILDEAEYYFKQIKKQVDFLIKVVQSDGV